MDPQIITSVGLSVAFALVVSVAVMLIPRRNGSGLAKSHTTQINELQARYFELSAENERLRDDFQLKLVEYTTAYHDWTRRETNYQNQIKLLEAKIEQLTARIRGLEGRSDLAKNQRNQKPIIIGIWPNADLDVASERDASYNAGFSHRALDGELATKANIIKEIEDHTGRSIIVEIGAHGTDAGTELYNDTAKPGWWRRILANREIMLVLLLSCESDEVARAIDQVASVDDVVSIQRSIVDEQAVIFAGALYRRLSQGDAMAAAVSQAKLSVTADTEGMIKLW